MSKTTQIDNFLTRGSDYVRKDSEFKLVGREDDLKRLSKALMRDRANSIILFGRGGVGCSSLCHGLQSLKDSAEAPVDLVTKRFQWLDTDGLFASGDTDTITDNFKKVLQTLSRLPESVLVIDDMRDFVDAARDNNCTHLINTLMREITQKKFQAIFETDEVDLDKVMKCHSDMKESFTYMELKEPGSDSLKLIVNKICKDLQKHHNIKVSEEAQTEAMNLTNKFLVRDMGLSRAQPERTMTLIDRALTTYRWKAHTDNPKLKTLRESLGDVNAKLETGIFSESQSKEELEIKSAALQSDITEISSEWEDKQKEIKKIHKDIRLAEDRISGWEDEINSVQTKEKEEAAKAEDSNEILLGDSNAITELRQKISKYKEFLTDYKSRFDEMTKVMNADLVLTPEHILTEFSSISGVPVDKLTKNEKDKLRSLEKNLGDRVWGQEEAVTKLAQAIKVAKSGLRESNKPQAAFLYLGPSGVGKTELVKALAGELLDDERALLRFDMSEYQERHSIAKLIGAPPGYEGYEAGGILTNAMFENPRRIILLDEIEKAHPDIFLILLQMLDDARLTDNKGRVADFSESIIVLTSNTGKDHFINPDLTFEEAKELAMKNLERGNGQDDKGLPPELLNRFGGRRNIVCFNKLDIPVIEKIAKRDLDKLNRQIQRNKPGLSISYDSDEIREMCVDNYIPVEGARGIVGFIEEQVKPTIANTLLFEDEATGVMQIKYNHETKEITVLPPRDMTFEEQGIVNISKTAFSPSQVA